MLEHLPAAQTQERWRTSPVDTYRGPVTAIREVIPTFERRSFELAGVPGSSEANTRLDTIVRLPRQLWESPVPVGVVSKDYALVPHALVLEVALDTLQKAGIELEKVEATVKLTEYGERMALSLFLPSAFQFDPGDGFPMALRLECFNSVEGSVRFRALVGWFRFVCSNGLVVGVTQHEFRRRHIFDLPLDGLAAVLRQGIADSEKERENFERWRDRSVSTEDLRRWADDAVATAWGVRAAARLFHIATTGCDAEVRGPYGKSASRLATTSGSPVPGAPLTCRTLYDASQALAWLARERRDVHEQIAWREQIPTLMAELE